MNLIAFSRSRNCVNTQYAALSGAMVNYNNYQKNTHNTCLLKLVTGWLVGFVALRLKSTAAMVIAGRSVHLNTLFPGQA